MWRVHRLRRDVVAVDLYPRRYYAMLRNDAMTSMDRLQPGRFFCLCTRPRKFGTGARSDAVCRSHRSQALFQKRAEWSAPVATAQSRIVTSANSGPLAKARRRSCRIRSALRRDQISVNPSSPPLPVTSELIDVGAASFLTPRLDPCSPGVLWPRPTRRAAIRNHATSLAKVAPFSALTRERKP